MKYKAFISYSQKADGKLAAALRQALQTLAKPFYKFRAMRVFHDKSGLSVTPELWPSIERALDESEYFLILASPEAASSQWVDREVNWWLRNRSTDTFLVGLTSGSISWQHDDFNWQETTALPKCLARRFSQEPGYVDLSWVRDEKDDSLSVRHSRFRDSVLDIAATLHNVDRDILDTDDVRQHRKFRLALGLTLLLLGTLLTAVAALVIVNANQRVTVEEQKRIRAEAEASEERALLEKSEAEKKARDEEIDRLRAEAVAADAQHLSQMADLRRREAEDRAELERALTLANRAVVLGQAHKGSDPTKAIAFAVASNDYATLDTARDLIAEQIALLPAYQTIVLEQQSSPVTPFPQFRALREIHFAKGGKVLIVQDKAGTLTVWDHYCPVNDSRAGGN